MNSRWSSFLSSASLTGWHRVGQKCFIYTFWFNNLAGDHHLCVHLTSISNSNKQSWQQWPWQTLNAARHTVIIVRKTNPRLFPGSMWAHKFIGVKRQFYERQEMMGGWLLLWENRWMQLSTWRKENPRNQATDTALPLATDYSREHTNICCLHVKDE